MRLEVGGDITNQQINKSTNQQKLPMNPCKRKKEIDIQNIIFDLGGVLLNIDYNRTINAFKALGMTDFDIFFTQAAQSQLFDRLDKGSISPENFRKELREITGLNPTDRQIDEAWNAMLLDMPPERVSLLKKVGENYRTFLLSNTNVIHYPVYMEYMNQTFGIQDLAHLFEEQYLSYQMGMRKPDKEIYDAVVRENDLDPQKTLFIDDSSQHVTGARETGLKALWLDVERFSIESLFNNDYRLKGVVRKMMQA